MIQEKGYAINGLTNKVERYMTDINEYLINLKRININMPEVKPITLEIVSTEPIIIKESLPVDVPIPDTITKPKPRGRPKKSVLLPND